MISFYSETDFKLMDETIIAEWISKIIHKEHCEEGDITFVFCDDKYLLQLNQQFLSHDTLTDIISFDNSIGKQLHGEIYISVERVKENAVSFSDSFEAELHRVLIHGIMHFCGFKDKTDSEAAVMRTKENEALALLKTS